MNKVIICAFLVAVSTSIVAGKPSGDTSTAAKTIKFAGYSTVTALANDSLVAKNEACRDAFPNSDPVARMASTDEMIAAMDDGTFIEPSSNALVRPNYVGAVSDGRNLGTLVDSLGRRNIGLCNGGEYQTGHSTYYLPNSSFSGVSCTSTTAYIVACSTAQ